MTAEQQRAMAIAAARKRQAEAGAQSLQPSQPAGRGFLTRVDDAMRGVADTASFGFADEASAGLGAATGIGGKQGDYAGNVAEQRARDSNGGWERVAGQVAGAFLNPMGAGSTVLKAAGSGALSGALYGLGSGEGDIVDRMPSAATGAVIGGVAGGALRKAADVVGNRLAGKTIATNADLRKEAERAYNKAEAAGVIFKPDGVKNLAREMVTDLAEFGFDPALQPGVMAVIKRFQGLDGKNVTMKGLDVIRRVANNAARVRDNPSQQEIARRIIDRIDDFIDNATEADVLMGNAKHGAAALKEARTLWGRFRRSETVDTAAFKADLRAASTGKGGNADNATRQNIRRLVENPRGFTGLEKEAAERVVRGTKGQNALRMVGSLAPTGIVSGGMGTSLGAAAGSALAGPAGAAVGAFAVPMVGQIAKSAADRMTIRNVERLSQIIRSGGVAAEDLGTLARKGQLTVPGLKRVENIAKALGVTVPELSAVMAEKAGAL